jgi:threonine/homoserine/homoserine lactone efflux protein
VALLARKLLKSRPGAARAVTLASGIIMVLLGAVLLAEQVVPLVAGFTQQA